MASILRFPQFGCSREKRTSPVQPTSVAIEPNGKSVKAAILMPSFSPTVTATVSRIAALVPSARGEARHVETSNRVCVRTGRDCGQRARY